MILIINTVPRDHFSILLARKAGEFKLKKVAGNFHQAEKLLPTIDALLKKEKLKLKDLRAIGVVVGPGGFTSVRVGVAVANGLGYGLGLPIIGVRADAFTNEAELVARVFADLKKSNQKKLVEPIYDREPNITIAKK